MNKWLYCLKETVAGIFRGKVNVLHQIPQCWVFYSIKYESLKSIGKTISLLKHDQFTARQKKESIKTLENLLAKAESKFSRVINIKNKQNGKIQKRIAGPNKQEQS